MFAALQLLALALLAIVLTTTLAHALEMPGIRRLLKEEYLAVQRIYYPGFTIAGGAEPLGMLVLFALSFLTEGVSFWLTLGALLGLLIGHGVYWLITHPVNGFWLGDAELEGAGRAFFAFAAGDHRRADWKELRDRWEYSHVARAITSTAAFASLAAAIVSGQG